MRLLGSKGTTGTQASFLELFEGDHAKIKELDRRIAEKMGFASCYAVSGQTYSRKVDTRVINVLAGIAASAHKFSNDIRLLQHLKENAVHGQKCLRHGKTLVCRIVQRALKPLGCGGDRRIHHKEQTEEFIAEVIQPVLDENRELLGMKAEINV